jgi:glycerophosphoryl diester phosphodiesterase
MTAVWIPYDRLMTASMTKPLVIAHRGDSSRALENSLESFRLALSIPVDMIELDIRRSRDNMLFVMHDRETARTANGNVNIEKTGSGEIAMLRLKNGEPVPTLGDVLALVDGRAGLNIEVKSAGAGALVASQLAASDYAGQVLVSSFKEREVVEARHVSPGIAVAGIFDVFGLKDAGTYKEKGYDIVSLSSTTISRELVDHCRGIGLFVYVWTVDNEKEMEKFLSWGVGGIYSNRPEVLRKIVG